ncbi:PREDICTED: uncharacterized protein LOC104768219 [Camelina sativa]|uniref:Uncharacterized protein LOC104768219 n=1 Tax=Camelina sativa TaxID=90675 RepID=A0ABM1RCE8_CAMSA|nr:PREDICTED: uncharacterized protein LOC104768219 [Camelina sativa]
MGVLGLVLWLSGCYSQLIRGLGFVWAMIVDFRFRLWLIGVSPELYQRIRIDIGVFIWGLGFTRQHRLSFSHFLLLSFSGDLRWLVADRAWFLRLVISSMSQSAIMKGKGSLMRTEVVKISNSVLAQRIQQFDLTLIGRLMNPGVQRIESLLSTMPKIWKLEDKVVGADLGQGTFQFNFADADDLQGVLQNGPYHFDSWMLSLVKWEPIVSPTYPSAINFWVRVSGIPMHLWEVATLEAIGKKIGIIRDIDEESGSVCVTVNGFNPIVFKLLVPFESGDEVVVTLEYEKLSGYCENCSRLTHDEKSCPELIKAGGSHVFEHHPEKRGVQRQQGMGNQGVFHNAGGWEKPRKVVKRALDFQAYEFSAGAGSSSLFHQVRHHGSGREQKRTYSAVASGSGDMREIQRGHGGYMGQANSFPLNRKGKGKA